MEYRQIPATRSIFITDTGMALDNELGQLLDPGRPLFCWDRTQLVGTEDLLLLVEGMQRIVILAHREIWESVRFYFQLGNLVRMAGLDLHVYFLIDRMDFWIFQDWHPGCPVRLLSGPHYARQLKAIWDEQRVLELQATRCRQKTGIKGFPLFN